VACRRRLPAGVGLRVSRYRPYGSRPWRYAAVEPSRLVEASDIKPLDTGSLDFKVALPRSQYS
jgi:hypothetical protein